MPRFFVTASNIFGGIAYLNGRDADHINVLRIRQGEFFTVCNGKGTDYLCRLLKTDGENAEAEIVQTVQSAGEPSVRCAVFAAFPKGDKAEHIIRKSVELGASKLLFFPSQRCVSRPDKTALINKRSRWQKISEEAAKQSGRGMIPEVAFHISFENAVNEAAAAELPLFFYEEVTDFSLKQVLQSKSGYNTVSIMTGSEGGFEPSEVSFARERGMLVTSMGSRILRCETAPLCALSAVMLHTDNL